MFKLSLEVPETNYYAESVYTTGFPCDVSYQQTTPTSDSDSLPDFHPIENDWMDAITYGFDHDALFRETTTITDVSYNADGNLYVPTTPPRSNAAVEPPPLVRKRRFEAVDAAVSRGHVTATRHMRYNPLAEAIANGRVSVRGFQPIEEAIQAGNITFRSRPENPHPLSLEHITTRARVEDAHLDALEEAIANGNVGIRQK